MLLSLDARIYGTDEKDVGEDDEDTDVDSQHYRGAARNNTDLHLDGGFLCSLLVEERD